MRRRVWAGLLLLMPVASTAAAAPPVVEYQGICNASAAVALDGDRFIVADDEDAPTTFLRVYRAGHPEGPVAVLPLLGLDLEEKREVDIEGAARIGDRIYWIGSHSASKDGEPRPNRRRLFATRVTTNGSQVEAKVVGEPYKHLIRDLEADPAYAGFGLKEAGKRAPKLAGALSIEGLAATPDGDLLIGFRNPIPEGKALIARLTNPKGVTEGKPAKFGPPIRLDLAGLGIRSLEWFDGPPNYLIIAGQAGEGAGSRLFRWSGDPAQPPKLMAGVDLTGLNPEAIYEDGRNASVLSDDGRRVISGAERDCAAPGASKTFRGVVVPLATP